MAGLRELDDGITKYVGDTSRQSGNAVPGSAIRSYFTKLGYRPGEVNGQIDSLTAERILVPQQEGTPDGEEAYTVARWSGERRPRRWHPRAKLG